MSNGIGYTQPGIAGAATVLGETGAAKSVGAMGEFMYGLKREQEQKREKRYDELLNVATDVWMADQKEFDVKLDEYKNTATDILKNAAQEGRDLSMEEYAQLRLQKNRLMDYRSRSLEQKQMYDKMAAIVMQNPEAYDVEGTLGNLNMLFRDKSLNERTYGNYLLTKDKMPVAYMDFVKGLGFSGEHRQGATGYRTYIDENRAAQMASSAYNTPQGREIYNFMLNQGLVKSPEQFQNKLKQDMINQVKRSSATFAAPKQEDEKGGFKLAKGYSFMPDLKARKPETMVETRTKGGRTTETKFTPVEQYSFRGVFEKPIQMFNKEISPIQLVYHYTTPSDEWVRDDVKDKAQAGDLKPWIKYAYKVKKGSKEITQYKWEKLTKSQLQDLYRLGNIFVPGIYEPTGSVASMGATSQNEFAQIMNQ